MVQHLQYAPGHKSESRLGTGQQSSSGVSGVVFDMSVLYKHPLAAPGAAAAPAWLWWPHLK